jgi:hypothetical protein
LQEANPLATRSVLSFLVTSLFARAKKEVTRSSAGGVEALALNIKTKKNWIPAFAGMTAKPMPQTSTILLRLRHEHQLLLA